MFPGKFRAILAGILPILSIGSINPEKNNKNINKNTETINVKDFFLIK